jgi:hypothetical protein
MKILHIWNTAGVASIISKTMDKMYCTQSNVIMKKDYDKFGVTTFGEAIPYKHNTIFHKADFFLKCLIRCRGKDVIHIHGLYKLVPIVAALFPNKFIVYHSHGSDMRHKWKQRRVFLDHANEIFYVSHNIESPDMPKRAIYLPNPVDTDLFNADGKSHLEGHALTFSFRADNEAIAYAVKHGLILDIIDSKKNPVKYTELPTLLGKYEYYLDFKRDIGGISYGEYCMSKTGLEALACGCKVVGWNGKTYKGLPKCHHPAYTVSLIWPVYLKSKNNITHARGLKLISVLKLLSRLKTSMAVLNL